MFSVILSYKCKATICPLEGNNIGIRYALEKCCKYIKMMNNKTFIATEVDRTKLIWHRWQDLP